MLFFNIYIVEGLSDPQQVWHCIYDIHNTIFSKYVLDQRTRLQVLPLSENIDFGKHGAHPSEWIVPSVGTPTIT